MHSYKNATRPGWRKKEAAGAQTRSRHMAEGLERRVLLSGYTMSELGYFGANVGGASPRSSIVVDSAGNLYGTTQYGGTYGGGTVFEIASGSTALTTLASFNGADGADPYAGVTLDAAGNLFGTTYAGGAFGKGTVFEIGKGSDSITTLASFNGTNGSNPYGGATLDRSGNIFGTTYTGDGAASGGTIFEIARGSNTITTLASFGGSSGSGYGPESGVALDSAGDLYGTTFYGGAYGGSLNGGGTVFELAKGSTTISTLASFDGYDGTAPRSGVTIDPAGNLYGTTSGGGLNDVGTVFEIAKGGSGIDTLFSFSNKPNDVNGSNPTSTLTLDAAGNLYGTTGISGAYGWGTVFEIVSGSRDVTTLVPFSQATGFGDEAGVTFDAAGNLFGATGGGGGAGERTVFEIAKGSASITTLVSFNRTNGGSLPLASPAIDAAGNLFGTTEEGGTSNEGTVFKIAKGSGIVTTLASFDQLHGETPRGSVVLDTAGNLYGTASAGGTYSDGAVFEVPNGSSDAAVVAPFNGTNGSGPTGGLIGDGAGDLYGTTSSGGANGYGTIFEIAKGSHSITTLVSFDPTNGGRSTGELTLDAAGNLYGTTEGDTVFELIKGSTSLKTLATLNSTGQIPSGVVVDSAGDLFGTTATGGSGNYGTAFEIPVGSTSANTLVSFNSSTGRPNSLVVAANGNLYGTTSQVPGGSMGTVFEIPRGTATLQTLITFDAANGTSPAALTVDASGNIYGTSWGGGAGHGTVFELSPIPVAPTIADSGGQKITLSADPDAQDIDWKIGTLVGQLAINQPNGLTVNGDGANDPITLDYSSGNPLPDAIHLNGTFTINGLTGSNPLAGITLDLSKGSTAYLAYPAGADPLAAIQTDLQTGYNAGRWTGTSSNTAGVITSAEAAANPTQLAIGYADSADPSSPDKIPNTIELKTTLVGDTNLDGSVNLADLLTLTRSFGKGSNWDQGDFNYDSSVNFSDFLALTRNFGKTLVVNALIVTSTADDGSLGTLRYAISHSNAGDTITFDPTVFAPGTSHILTLNGSQLELTHNLTIQGPGSANLSISGNNASRIFQIDPSVTASISGLTLTSGNAAAAYGGAINNSGTLNLANCSITSSTATDGGGLYSISGSANVSNCTFSNDTASAYGGALFNDAQATSTVTGCTFLSNSAGHGGALLDYGTALILINDTITQNSSTGSGGGINNVAGNLVVSNCTIVNNTTGSAGGGIYNGQTATINNSIVAQNSTTSASPTDLAGNSFSGSYNLIGDGSGGLSASNHNLLGSTSSLLNPKLGSLSNSGGPTLTFMPLSGSPVIDAGSNALISSGISTDQRSYSRIFNGTVDIGAVEFGSSLAPTLINATQQPALTTARRRV